MKQRTHKRHRSIARHWQRMSDKDLRGSHRRWYWLTGELAYKVYQYCHWKWSKHYGWQMCRSHPFHPDRDRLMFEFREIEHV